MRYFSSHADTFAQRWMWVNRLADIDCVCAHFNRQSNLANHVSCVGADHAAAKDLAMAPAMSMAVRAFDMAVVKQQPTHFRGRFRPRLGSRRH